MAKWGEGDPRWIVEERPDATNVNNWHWLVYNEYLILYLQLSCEVNYTDYDKLVERFNSTLWTGAKD